jgi:hypothetical protein
MRFNFQAIAPDSLYKSLDQEINWSRLLNIATEQQVIPMLYQTLKKFENVPQSVLADLQKINRFNGIKNITLTKELLRVLQVLDHAGIEAIAFKGAALAVSAYGSLTMRQFGDLDILVKHSDFAKAKAILAKEGYLSNLPLEVEIDLFERILQTPLYSKNYTIDLHWGLPPRRNHNPNHYDFLWQSTGSLTIQDQAIKILIPELVLVFQSVNFAGDREDWRLLKPICDLAQVIKTYPDLDWNLAIYLAGKLRCKKLFVLGLYIAHRVLDISVPVQISEMFAQVENLDVSTTIDLYFDDSIKPNRSFIDTCILSLQRRIYPLKTLDKKSNQFDFLWLVDTLFIIKLLIYSLFVRIWQLIKSDKL